MNWIVRGADAASASLLVNTTQTGHACVHAVEYRVHAGGLRADEHLREWRTDRRGRRGSGKVCARIDPAYARCRSGPPRTHVDSADGPGGRGQFCCPRTGFHGGSPCARAGSSSPLLVFEDGPTSCEVSDRQGDPLPTEWSGISIGDVDSDGAGMTDWQEYVAGADACC